MDRLAQAVILSWGWRRRFIALFTGALSALAQAPFFAFPVLWLTFPVFVWLLDGSVATASRGGARRFWPAFSAGWWFGFGYFLAGLWWIGAAFLVDAEQFAWLLPLAVIALPAGLAMFWGLAAAAAQLFWRDDWRRILALAAALGTAEWARGHVLTGFPWNAIGYALTAGEVLMQSAAAFGLHALNILAVLIFAAPAALVPPSAQARRNIAIPALALASLGGLALFGFIRLDQAPRASVPDVTVRIVQPAIEQAEKWKPENRQAIFQSYLNLSNDGGLPEDGTGLVLVWPESAFPFALTEEPGALAAIGTMLPDGASLVTGAARVEAVSGSRASDSSRRVFNSVYVINDRGEIDDAYDKVHLVPFGEYLPFQKTLESFGLQQLTKLPGGFSAGPRRRALALPAAPAFSPLICYEIIFPGEVVPDDPRPGFMLNVTNDSWYGRTPGPYQHLHQARVRSVEEGLPL
ncbi:MAG TPA: apolipoprotein N-acyltransferase, partial [Afifellaceae bacterium]|nr:apolipoprotein N-acyltransferase [Afifellaceae bacterium]